MKRILLTFTGAAVTLAAGGAFAQSRADLQFFENKIRPILAENCYKCHNASEGKPKGDLGLNTKEGVLKGGTSGPAIVPGSPEKSLLIKAISYTDPDLQMPPKGEKLTTQQIADLTQWVKMGAPDPRDEKKMPVASKLSGLTDKARAHWTYQPVRKPADPKVQDKRWVKTPVDSFILAKLEEKGMKPSPPAGKEALLRRATFDLIGMPPTTDELKAFLADNSPDAFAKVVDRLLASSHYGERWGRHWLDTARYSDTSGNNNNNERDRYRYAYAWAYRDYVIKAFNQDKPYDQFILEQIAADKLTLKDPTDLAALGFLTVGERFQNRNDVINDRIDAVTKGFLGLTVSCARCHDHMFDPIPTADYYSLHGIFNSVTEPAEKPIIGKVADNAQLQDYLKKREELERQNRETYYKALDKMLTDFRQKAGPYVLASAYSRGRQSPEKIKLRNDLIKQYKLDEYLVRNGGGLGYNRPDDPVFGPLFQFAQLPTEEFATKGKDLAATIAANQPPRGRRAHNPLVAAAFKNTAPKSLGEVAAIYGALYARLEPQARAYFNAKQRAKTDEVPGFDTALAQLVERPFPIASGGDLSMEDMQADVDRWPRQIRYRIPFVFTALNELDLTHPGAPARAMVVEDQPNPRNSPIFIRGQAEVRGEVVPRRFLEALSGPDRPEFKVGSGRLELARAIASKDNPITARVMINRVWMHHFGEGFVPTPDDLGVQSEKPVHPELIDWLSSYFMDNGWSLKKLHRVIMLSSVYQQSTDNNPRYAQIDPNNRLHWRANIRRLDFEAIRDSLLVFSGNLDPVVGGKPINLTEEPYSFRRSVYGYVDRGNLPELMQQFDFSDPDMPNSKRATTIVPQQALFLMNSPMAVDVSRRMIARREFTSARDDAGRIAALYNIIFQRTPKPEEIKVGLAYVTDLNRLLAPEPTVPVVALNNANARAARNAKAAKAAPRPQVNNNRRDGRAPIRNQGEMVERSPLSAWEQYAQALLFANELAYVN
jgi:mono/diheme cytochrome c family protein